NGRPMAVDPLRPKPLSGLVQGCARTGHPAPPTSLLRTVVRGSRPSNLPADLCRDVLDFEVLVDALVATLAPEPRLLHPAEGPRRVRDQPAVEPHHARFQSLDHSERPIEIAGVGV